MKKEIFIAWFRQDLRTSDNPALAAASLGKIMPIYIFDETTPEMIKMGSTSKVWLHHSLEKLNNNLEGNLNFYIGESDKIIASLIEQYQVQGIFWNKCYEPWHLNQENKVISVCNQHSVNWKAFNGCYLWSPTEIMKEDASYYKVFTAYKNKALKSPPRSTIKVSKTAGFIKGFNNQTSLSSLNLLPKHKWYRRIEEVWDFGEEAAKEKLASFINNHLNGYKESRNYPYKKGVSMLSPHLHFGEISPAQVLEAVKGPGMVYASETDIESFVNELIWREFSCYLMYHFESLHKDNFNGKFNNFPWKVNPSALKAWQTGNTGYPLVDAGMRELWQTGYMHNRVRMVVASFLIKNLNIPWKQGMDWFWDCLVDADLANNSASWQWVAGSGADAAPYFRIFNPITQGEKFDSDGDYTRTFIPELKYLPNKYLFKPWTAPEGILKTAGVTLGLTYPRPIVDFSTSRKEALEHFSNL